MKTWEINQFFGSFSFLQSQSTDIRKSANPKLVLDTDRGCSYASSPLPPKKTVNLNKDFKTMHVTNNKTHFNQPSPKIFLSFAPKQRCYLPQPVFLFSLKFHRAFFFVDVLYTFSLLSTQKCTKIIFLFTKPIYFTARMICQSLYYIKLPELK